jgi:ferric-dicitrate binding protein FerR (iron transport regulator)
MDKHTDKFKQEDDLIRGALQQMEIPSRRESLKQSFIERARKRYAPEKTWGDIWIKRLALAGTACYAILAAAYLWVVFDATAVQDIKGINASDWRIYYNAALGEIVQYQKGDQLLLTDGSTISCLVDSSISVVYTIKQRLIELRQGTIEIKATHNRNYPMVVYGGEAEIRVTGTRFVVSTDKTYWEKESAL